MSVALVQVANVFQIECVANWMKNCEKCIAINFNTKFDELLWHSVAGSQCFKCISIRCQLSFHSVRLLLLFWLVFVIHFNTASISVNSSTHQMLSASIVATQQVGDSCSGFTCAQCYTELVLIYLMYGVSFYCFSNFCKWHWNFIKTHTVDLQSEFAHYYYYDYLCAVVVCHTNRAYNQISAQEFIQRYGVVRIGAHNPNL